MSDGVTSFVFACGFGTWVYSQMMRNTNSSKSSLIGAAVSGVIAFIVLFTLIRYIFHF